MTVKPTGITTHGIVMTLTSVLKVQTTATMILSASIHLEAFGANATLDFITKISPKWENVLTTMNVSMAFTTTKQFGHHR